MENSGLTEEFVNDYGAKIQKQADEAKALGTPILPPKTDTSPVPHPVASDFNSGIVVGLGLIVFGIFLYFIGGVLQDGATQDWVKAEHRLQLAMKEHPHRKVKASSVFTPEEARDLLDSHSTNYQWMFPVGFFTILLGLAFLINGIAGYSAGEFVVSGVTGYVAYKGVKKILK